MSEKERNPYLGALVLLLSLVAVYDVYNIVLYIGNKGGVKATDFFLHMKMLIFITFFMVLIFIFKNLIYKLKSEK
ncbi:MAG: hypothetical protein DRJ37_00465 [Thermoprotei archaeon]|nr:MAG: hypothetical protein DRJ37_00465 [Thermoprotei archaeon]